MTTLTPQDRADLSRIIIDILENWEVRPADQINLLGLPSTTRPRHMKRYGEDLCLPEDPDVWQRVEHLVGIAEALRTSYPRNPAMGGVWLNRRNYRFDDRSPLAAMLEDGMEGMMAVRVHLDCAYDWFMDDRANKDEDTAN
jgi:hypothetical protein